MLIANSAAALANLAMGEQISAVYPAMPSWGLPVLALGGVVNVVCAAALLNWRKWGFFGFIATTVVGTSVNAMAGLPVTQLALGLVGIVVLYGVMQIGEPTGWSQMR